MQLTENQCHRILCHMQEHPDTGITQLEALDLYGCMRLASRIADLRRRGYRIETRRVCKLNRDGHKVNFARYMLVGD